MHSLVLAYIRSESGSAAAEYAVMLVIIGAGIFGAVTALGADIVTALGNAGNAVKAYTY